MAAGEVASGMATDAIYSHLMQPSLQRVTEPARFAERLQEALETANGDIHEYALSHPELRGMGTTATAVGLLGDSVYVAHVGALTPIHGPAVAKTIPPTACPALIAITWPPSWPPGTPGPR